MKMYEVEMRVLMVPTWAVGAENQQEAERKVREGLAKILSAPPLNIEVDTEYIQLVNIKEHPEGWKSPTGKDPRTGVAFVP